MPVVTRSSSRALQSSLLEATASQSRGIKRSRSSLEAEPASLPVVTPSPSQTLQCSPHEATASQSRGIKRSRYSLEADLSCLPIVKRVKRDLHDETTPPAEDTPKLLTAQLQKTAQEALTSPYLIGSPEISCTSTESESSFEKAPSATRTSVKRGADTDTEEEDFRQPVAKRVKTTHPSTQLGNVTEVAVKSTRKRRARRHKQNKAPTEEGIEASSSVKANEEINPKSLQGLPTELQLEIFRRALEAQVPIRPKLKELPNYSRKQRRKYHQLKRASRPRYPQHLGVGLMTTCKDFRNKAASILYENQIDFSGIECRPKNVQRFRRAIGPVNRHLVRHVVIGARIIKPVSMKDVEKKLRARYMKVKNAQKSADIDFLQSNPKKTIRKIAATFDNLETLEIRTNRFSLRMRNVKPCLKNFSNTFKSVTIVKGPRNHPRETVAGEWTRHGKLLKDA